MLMKGTLHGPNTPRTAPLGGVHAVGLDLARGVNHRTYGPTTLGLALIVFGVILIPIYL